MRLLSFSPNRKQGHQLRVRIKEEVVDVGGKRRCELFYGERKQTEEVQ